MQPNAKDATVATVPVLTFVATTWLLFAAVISLFSFFANALAVYLSFAMVLGLSFWCYERERKYFKHPGYHVDAHVVPFFFVVLCIQAASCGAACGMFNYHNYVALYYAAAGGRAYTNVEPKLSGTAYQDAGTISFNDAFVDDQNAVGYKDKDGTFCVAPILGRTSDPESVDTKANFWAVGLDCCSGDRGDFRCGDVTDPEVKGGVVMQDVVRIQNDGFLSPETHRDLYMRAIQQASAYGLKTPANPVLMFWVASPALQIAAWMSQSLWVLLICGVGELVLLIGMVFFLKFVVFKALHWSEQAGYPGPGMSPVSPGLPSAAPAARPAAAGPPPPAGASNTRSRASPSQSYLSDPFLSLRPGTNPAASSGRGR